MMLHRACYIQVGGWWSEKCSRYETMYPHAVCS